MYFFWALLPITLFLMAVWAWLKPIFKLYGKEDGKRNFMMSMFCSAILFLTVVIDRSEVFKQAIPKLSFGMLEHGMVRWFLYPALLYVSTLLWDMHDQKKK